MQSNYHTHTTRCHHAQGSDEDYVKTAIVNGYDELGFSDHACWPYRSGYKSRIRMDVDEFEDYKQSVLKLKKKYQDKIKILLGMEAEYYPDYMDWLLEFAANNDLDYLIFGNHFLGSEEYGPYNGSLPAELEEAYYDTCIAGMKTGLYACLAHPELIMRTGREWNESKTNGFRRVCEAAKELNIPLEFNCLGWQMNLETGIEQYPHHEFWNIAAKTGCKAIIGMDAHDPQDLDHHLYDSAKAYLEQLGLEVVDHLEPTDFKALSRQKKEQKQAAEYEDFNSGKM